MQYQPILKEHTTDQEETVQVQHLQTEDLNHQDLRGQKAEL